MACLAPELREVWQLTRDGRTPKEIACQLRCTEDTVRERLREAKRQLRAAEALNRCGSSCALDKHPPGKCQAENKKKLLCVKWLWIQDLRTS